MKRASTHDSGLLVISLKNSAKARIPAISLSHQEIRLHYVGIEGDPWPDEDSIDGFELTNGLAPIEDYLRVVSYFGRVRGSYENCKLIYICAGDMVNIKDGVPRHFVLRGYDYGYYQSQWNSYSVLLNEVVYGMYDSMRRYGNQLNANLLLDTPNAALMLHRTRSELLKSGADLESNEDGDPGVIQVFSR